MTEDDLQSMQGQIRALSTVICKILTSLPATHAAQMSVELATEKEVELQQDSSEGIHPSQTRGMSAVLGGFVELLEAVAENG